MRSNFIGKSLHCCYSPRRLVCHEICASNVDTTRWIAAGGGCGGGPVVEQRSLVCSSRNGEICRTWGGDQRDREEWKISFQELDGLEGLDWEGLEGLEWLEVVRLEFLELEELDLELQKLRVSEKKMKKNTTSGFFLCWKTSVWKWSLGGDKLEEKWPGLSFVAHWGRGDMLDHVGRNNEKVGIHSGSRVWKRNGFTTTGSIWQENEPSWRSIQEDLPRCVGKAKCFGKMFWPSILWDVGHQLASKAAPEYGERVSFAVAVGDVGSGNPIGENGGGTWCLTLTVHT